MLRHFFNCIVPVYSCNFRCKYCFVHQTHAEEGKTDHHLDVEKIREALTISRCGKSFMNLCASGETLFQPEIIEIAESLLENGHVVAIVTNLTYSKKVDELCDFPEELRHRLFIKASFHYEQLKSRELLDVYFENIRKLHKAGISYSIEIVANDDIADEVSDIIEIFKEYKEPMPQIIESRETVSGNIGRLTDMDISKHLNTWNQFDSDMFAGMQEFWGVKRKEFCYAGEYSAAINLKTGFMQQCDKCHSIQNIYQNPDEQLLFCAIGENCQISHCYISYVWQRLCGNVRSLPHRPYYLTRNRMYHDGSEWLSPEVKEEFSHVIGEADGYYSQDKEAIVGGIMDAYYKGRENVSKEKTEVISVWFKRLLKECSAKMIAIYGCGQIGLYVKEIIDGMDDVRVIAMIDRSKDKRVEGVVGLSPEDLKNGKLVNMGVDTVIITPLTDSISVRKMIQQYNKSINTFDILFNVNKEK